MPFVLIVIGVILLVTAIQGTTGQLGSMLRQDVFPGGGKGYLYWFVAIFLIGAIGYEPKLRPISRGLLVLVVLVLLISQGGFFAKFSQALGQIGQGVGSGSTATPGTTFGSYTGLGSAAPIGTDQSKQILQGVPEVVAPNAPGYEVQPIPGL